MAALGNRVRSVYHISRKRRVSLKTILEHRYTEEGHQYFYNSSTGESQWEDPREQEKPPDTARDRRHPLVPHLRLGRLRKQY